MRIATVERFAKPSRRCDSAPIAGPEDEILVWELGLAGNRAPTLVDVVRAVPAWLTMRVPWRRRWQLLQACWAPGISRRVAVVRVPGWIRRLRAGEIDEVTCFSTYGFPLVPLLASETGRPAGELIASGTKYLGEFAFEHLAVIPYAYWLHQQGRLRFTISTPDTRSFYFFSPNHIEVPVKRSYVPITEFPIGERGDERFDQKTFPSLLDTARWLPPPYRDVYGEDARFQWPKPPIIVCNKTSSEAYLGGDGVVNSLDVGLVLALVEQLRDRYTVIYNRPREADIVGDHDANRECGDHEALVEAFPDVITIQQLHDAHPDLSFNELQLRLYGTSERFVSVLGGSSYLASYFGGTNIVYARAGREVDCGAFEGWFRLFSGARVIAVDTPGALLDTVQREWISESVHGG